MSCSSGHPSRWSPDLEGSRPPLAVGRWVVGLLHGPLAAPPPVGGSGGGWRLGRRLGRRLATEAGRWRRAALFHVPSLILRGVRRWKKIKDLFEKKNDPRRGSETRAPAPVERCHRCVVDGGCMLRHRLSSALLRSHHDVRKGDGGALLQRGHGRGADAADSVKCEGTKSEWRCLRLPNQGVLRGAGEVGGSE